MFLKCSESIGLFSETKEPVFKPEHENAVSVNEVNEVEKVPRMITGSAKQSIFESEPRIVGEVVVPELIISEPEQAGDKLCQRIVAKPDLLVIEHEELINEPKRTAQPTQVGNRHTEIDTVINFESSNESENGGILDIRSEIEELITEPKRTAQPTQVCNRHVRTGAVIILESSSEPEDGGILEIQPQISKVLHVFIQ